MKRRDFIEKTTGTIIALNSLPFINGLVTGATNSLKFDDIFKKEIIDAPPALRQAFEELLQLLGRSPWNEYFKSVANVDFSLEDTLLDVELKRPLGDLSKTKGLEDFAGVRMIEPGLPSMSLLYHVLASPRVVPFESENEYFELEQIDSLEDYICSLLDLKIPESELRRDYVFAVFAYEYRPAYKTPDDCCRADFVYSRIGISRIGEFPQNYNKKSRSFFNKPLVGEPKHIAVTPARYALFLAKRVPADQVCLMSTERGDNPRFFRFIKGRSFLQPVRKVFNGDKLLNGGRLIFHESHLNVKLLKLAERMNGDFPRDVYDISRAPFVRKSFSNTESMNDTRQDSDLVDIKECGSSALVSSVPSDIVRVAKQFGKVLSFRVPKKTSNIFDSTRRYTSLKLQDHTGLNATDYLITEGVYKKHKPTRFNAPRNAPLFVNIRNEVSAETYQITRHLGGDASDFEEKIEKGGYMTAMFEDSICDGCVTAQILAPNMAEGILKEKLTNCLPAFSLVTAPDFFPLVDSFDLEKFDEHGDSSFLEGGTENLSTSRLAANPSIYDPVRPGFAFQYSKSTNTMQQEEKAIDTESLSKDNIEYEVSDTMAAIVSGFVRPTNSKYVEDAERFRKSYDRDYKSTSYLTDTASFIFAPGWDVTYSGYKEEKGVSSRIFMSTFGLGSPFPEDMKLCAAANGMWPVSSPDAARTFQGSLAPLPIINKVTPTAIPLMDQEIGIHGSHPALLEPGIVIAENYGWDGEQGPFIEKYQGQFGINFTDVGRADYLENLRTPGVGFNMTQLRELDCTELIFRMECLRKCKVEVEGRKDEFSRLWLVSAEKVVDWGMKAGGAGIPVNIVGTNREWAIQSKSELSGAGFLFVYADPIYEVKSTLPKNFSWVSQKRRRISCHNIIVCQVTSSSLRWCKIPASGLKDESEVKWKHA